MKKQTNAKKIIKDYYISVIAVLDNDADILSNFIKETLEILKDNYENYEFILIDNDSHDNTSEMMDSLLKKEECLRYVKLSKQYDTEVALSAGLDIAIGDAIITLEPQYDPPKLIPKFVEKTIQKTGIVYGIRTNFDRKMPVSYKLGKETFHMFCKMFFEFSPPKNAGFFMGMSRAALNAITQIKSRSKFLRVFGRKIGHKVDTIEYKIVLRRRRIRKKSFMESLNYGISVIFSNSHRPLRVISYLGFFAAIANLLYVIAIIVAAYFQRSLIQGWTIVSVQNAIMYFLIFTIIAMFVEFSIRSTETLRDEPSYYIDYEKDSNVMIRNEKQRRNIYESAR